MCDDVYKLLLLLLLNCFPFPKYFISSHHTIFPSSQGPQYNRDITLIVRDKRLTAYGVAEHALFIVMKKENLQKLRLTLVGII